MFTSVSARSANAYKSVGVETSVLGADAHQLVRLLYDALLQSLGTAKLSIQARDIPAKGRAIGKAVCLIEEGLKAGLNDAQGGDLAANLRRLYDYCILVLTEANLHSNEEKIDEVARLIKPLAQAWNAIQGEAAVSTGFAHKLGA